MKINKLQANVLNGTNKLISPSYADWSAIRQGSFIKFVNDANYYIVANTNKLFYIKEFEVADTYTIRVNDNVSNILSEDDTLVISYKEYEVNSINTIENGGANYQKGDILTIVGGTASFNVVDNTTHPANILVISVDNAGFIKEMRVNSAGKYVTPPDEIVELSGGNGKGAKIRITHRLLENRAIFEQDIEQIQYQNGNTLIKFHYPLPPGIKEGKFSTEKWEIVLNTIYVGPNRCNEPFDVVRDFTPVYGFPLMTRNSFSADQIYNLSIVMLEKKLKELEDKIKS